MSVVDLNASVAETRIFQALTKAIWAQDSGALSVGHTEPDPSPAHQHDVETELLVDGVLDVMALAKAVAAVIQR